MVSISQIRNIANYATRYAESLGKTSVLQTKALENVSFEGLKFSPKITGLVEDTLESTRKLVSADSSLFSWAKKQPNFSFQKMNPDSVALVHMTNYFPKNGEILSTNLATKAADGVGASRTTVHFCLNKPVVEHLMGSGWNTMDYAIILPFNGVIKNTPKSKILGGINEDFMFQDLVKLPKGSVIVKYNPNVPEGKFLTSDAFEGIKLVESSNKKLSESADTVIKKMGFTTYDDALKNYLGATDKEIQTLTAIPESGLMEQMDLINKLGGPQKYKQQLEESYKSTLEMFGNEPECQDLIKPMKANLEFATIIERYYDKLQKLGDSCKSFCGKENIFSGRHAQSPWMKSEFGITAIETTELLNNNSWGKSLKNRIISILQSAKADIPKGKSLGYDIDKAIEIVEKSETPKIAKERLAKELKIKPMAPRGDVQKSLKENEFLQEGEDGVEMMLSLLSL